MIKPEQLEQLAQLKSFLSAKSVCGIKWTNPTRLAKLANHPLTQQNPDSKLAKHPPKHLALRTLDWDRFKIGVKPL